MDHMGTLDFTGFVIDVRLKKSHFSKIQWPRSNNDNKASPD